MSVYTGYRRFGNCTVYKDGVLFTDANSLKVRNHSPTGFNWGYRGSGPAQLSLALLLEEYDTPTAKMFYQLYKEQVIAALQCDTWELTSAQILNWICEHSRFEKSRFVSKQLF